MEAKKIPYIPILGDSNNIVGFGGAEIVFLWMRGAGFDTEEPIFKKWFMDEEASILFCTRDFNYYNVVQIGKRVTLHAKYT